MKIKVFNKHGYINEKLHIGFYGNSLEKKTERELN